jgi:hypothetical protein
MHPDLDPQPRGLTRLLRELPAESAPPYGYSEFERRARERARGARSLAGGRRLAVAAVIGVGGLALLVRLSGPVPLANHAHDIGTRAAPPPALGPDDDALPPRAGAGERWLASLPSEPAVVHVGTRAAVVGLEDRIAQLDDLLTAARGARAAPARLAALQRERSRLLGTLVQVRYAETLANETP